MNAKEYTEQLAQSAGLSQEEKDNLLKIVAGNEKLAKGLEEGVMLRSDYSRKQDELKADKEKTSKYYGELVTWKATEQERLDALYAGNGNGNGERTVIQTVQNPDVVTKRDMEAELQKRDGQFIGLLETGMSIASRHAVEFKEPLDTAALKKIAMDKNLSLQAAYDEMVAPRRAETGTAQRKAEIEAAKAEGAREFASKHKIPVDTTAREAYHPIFDRDPKKQVGADSYVPNSGQLGPADTRQLRDNFVTAWETAPVRGTSGT